MSEKIAGAFIELEDSVQQAFSLLNYHDHDHDHGEGENNEKKSYSKSNTYERKRSLRRIERSINSLQKYLTIMESQNQSQSQQSHQCSLSDPSLEALMAVITELPKSNMVCSSETLQGMYDSIVSVACPMIQQYAVLPLQPHHLDRLLERITHIALLQGNIHLGILQLLNSNLVEFERLNDNHHDNDNDDSGGQSDRDCEDDEDHPHLEANSRNGSGNYNGDGDHASISISMREPILLTAQETQRLTQILIPLSLKHLSQPWIFMEKEDQSRLQSDRDGVDWDEQKGGLQLRVLLSFLFRHFVAQIEKMEGAEMGVDVYDVDDDDDDDPNLGSDDCGERRGSVLLPVSRKLENILFELFQRQLVDAGNDNPDHGDIVDMVEDYTDLITSFLVENIDYAIDAVENSSIVLREYATYTADGVGVERDVYTINRHVKDAARLSSLAVGMIELFHDDLGLAWDAFKSHTSKLHKEFSQFVAMYCTDKFLHDAENATCTIESADNILIRLATRVASECHGGNAKPASFEPDSKRRRVLPNDCDQLLDKASVATLLRTFYSSKTKDSEIAMPLLEHEMDKTRRFISDTLAGPTSNAIVSVPEGQRRLVAAHELSTLVQSCALSTLVSPRGMDPSGETDRRGDNRNDVEGNMALFSTLVKPLLGYNDKTGCEADNQNAIPATVVDSTNPWNFLLARGLPQKLSSMDEERYTDERDIMPPMAITTCSASSVSDLRSNNTSSTGRCGRTDHNARYWERIAFFSNTVQDPINTL